MVYRENWTLDTIFPGGVEGEAFKLSVTSIEHALAEHERQLTELGPIQDCNEAWRTALSQHLDIEVGLRTPFSFTGAWSAVRASDPEPATATKRLMLLSAKLQECWVPLIQQMDQLSDSDFETFIAPLGARTHSLRTRRAQKHLRGCETSEGLTAQFEPQALHGWGDLYKTVAGRLKATIQREGHEPEVVGISQAASLIADSDEAVRKMALDASTAAWKTEESLCCLALNNITETRQKRNKRAKIDDLEHTLQRNRLDREALEAMWTACETARPALLRYIDRKNKLLGHDTLHPWNMRAPLQLTEDTGLSWNQACSDIIASFNAFDPAMGQFAERALVEGWVDAKPGPNRRMGGFCTSASAIEESRIFMTYSGNLRSAMTLAHELGHAYHNEILFDQDPAMRSITSSTAESASTFAEALFRDFMFAKAKTDAVRIQMLDQQLMSGVTFLISLPIRFEYERALYLLAEQGPFTAKKLTNTWTRLWKQGYGGRLTEPSTHGWCSTLHYYISHFGYYNWPYTFGYLFSGYVYQQAQQEGEAFRESFRNLLLGTGHMDSVPLVKETLGADLRDPGFWINAIQPLLDIEKRFSAMTDPLVAENISEA